MHFRKWDYSIFPKFPHSFIFTKQMYYFWVKQIVKWEIKLKVLDEEGHASIESVEYEDENLKFKA